MTRPCVDCRTPVDLVSSLCDSCLTPRAIASRLAGGKPEKVEDPVVYERWAAHARQAQRAAS